MLVWVQETNNRNSYYIFGLLHKALPHSFLLHAKATPQLLSPHRVVWYGVWLPSYLSNPPFLVPLLQSACLGKDRGHSGFQWPIKTRPYGPFLFFVSLCLSVCTSVSSTNSKLIQNKHTIMSHRSYRRP